MTILTLFSLTEAANAKLTAAGWHVIPAAAYTPAMAEQIDVILGWNEVGAQLIAGPNHVKFIQTASAGVDYLPLAALQAQGILLANTSGIHAQPIASSTLAMVLAFARGLVPRATTWDAAARRDHMWDLAGQRAVVFGTGHIGQAIALRLAEQGMTVWGISRHGAPAAGFARVGTDAQTADFARDAAVIVNVMPLTAATHHFFDATFFADLTGKPLFVNVGRGPSVDEAALLAALHAGRLRGVALDVFETEPLPATDPLWLEPLALITPHVSGTVTHLRQAVFDILWPNLTQLAATGTLARNQVDLSAGY